MKYHSFGMLNEVVFDVTKLLKHKFVNVVVINYLKQKSHV